MTTNTTYSKIASLTILVLGALATTFNLAAQEPCELYCGSKEATFMERCSADDNAAELCTDAWYQAHDTCLSEQCSLEVQVPGEDELSRLAEALVPELLGPDFRVIERIPHYYDSFSGEAGSFVFSLFSEEKGAAFLEIGASEELPPVVCFGTDLPAADALHQRAVESLVEVFGEAEYQLERRYLTAAHPVLEFVSEGQFFYYSVAFDGVSPTFVLDQDPDADQEALAIRREANKRQWRTYLDTYLY